MRRTLHLSLALTAALRATLVAGAAFSCLAPAAQAAGYVTTGTCAGWPAVAVPAARGRCVALLAGPAQGLRFPRRLLEVAPQRFWLTDMGGWEPGRGRLLELRVEPGPTPSVVLRTLAEGLDRPHGLALGPDGKVYVGEAGRVWRTAIAQAVQQESVLEGLPADGSHPLKELAFGPDGRLFVNVGSATDDCTSEPGRAPATCAEVQGERPRAAVYEARLSGPDFRVSRFQPYASGLRNSLALAWEPGAGVLWQGENSVDYADATLPPEELNRLQAGSQHGWPYCVGDRQPARRFADRGAECRRTQAPVQNWPAHVAPLQLLFAPRNLQQPWAGQMLVAWHGYRAGGHRVVGFPLDAQGQPASTPVLWFGGAEAAGQPRPAPAGITLDSAGRLFIVDDRNRSVLMLGDKAP